jgi:hypothetical protein
LLAGLEAVTVSGTLGTALTIVFTGVSGDADLLVITDNTLSIPAVVEQQKVTFDNVPTNGVFKLNWGGETTAAINFNDNAAAIEGKIQALTGLSGVTVSGDFSVGFTFVMTGQVGDVAIMTVSDNTLNIAAVIEQQTITAAQLPTNGTYKLNYGAEATGALAFDADAAAVQVALRLLTGLGSVTVAGDFNTQFTVTFTGVSGNLALMTVSECSLNIPAVVEIQNIAFSAVPDAGSCRFSYGGVNSTLINENDDSAALQVALRTIPALSAVTVAGTFAASFDVTMTGVVGNASMLIEAESNFENTGAPVTSTITESTPGSAIVNITPTIAETVTGVANAATTPSVAELVKGVTENASITITPLETVTGVAIVNVTPVVAETVTGKAIENITPVPAEATPGEDEPVTTEVEATTPGVLADGFVLAAGAILNLSGSDCPTDAIYGLASGEATPVELGHS